MQGKKQRIAAITAMLVKNPGKLYSLKHFQELFGVAKSGISEDISVIKDAFGEVDAGVVETILGAHGGVRFLPRMSADAKQGLASDLIRQMSDTSRILPGGYIYLADLFYTPRYVDGMAQILAEWLSPRGADFIITIETKGIPLAMSVARFLDLPVAIARKHNTPADGSTFSANYLTGSSRRLQTMSIPRRMLREGTRALVIDDFIGGGGTLKALTEMLTEFRIHVAGIGTAIANKYPQKKKISNYESIFILEELSETRIEFSSNV